jgi:hypothetical protein
LLLQWFRATIGETVNEYHPRPAARGGRRWNPGSAASGLVVIRQNQNVSTTFSKGWSHDYIGRTASIGLMRPEQLRMKKCKGNQSKTKRGLSLGKSRKSIMKHLLILVGFLYGFLPANAQQVSFKEIRTASPTVLVAFFKDAYWSGPVYSQVWATNQVMTTDLSLWKLNGQPVTGASRFVTEANAVDYHIYLQVPKLANGTAYTLETPYGNTNFVFNDAKTFCESIKVNQNGYSALSHVRYANLAIWLGDGGAQPISEALPTYTVFKQFTGEQVASGTLQQIGTGQDTSSGDYVYRMDLSGVPEGGPYIVSVSGYGCSYPFGVGGDFSRRLGYVAFRSLAYNRCGSPLIQPYAWANIRPYPCHTNVYDSEASNSPDTLPANRLLNKRHFLQTSIYDDSLETFSG